MGEEKRGKVYVKTYFLHLGYSGNISKRGEVSWGISVLTLNGSWEPWSSYRAFSGDTYK